MLSASTLRGRKGHRSVARADEGEVVTKSSTEKRSIEGDSRRVRRASAKEAVVDLVSDTSEVGEDDLACSSATSIGNLDEFQQPKRKRRSGRVYGAVSALRGKEVREEADSDVEEELVMGSYGEVELAQARDDTVDSPRTLALEVEVILEGLQETLSEGINRVRRLIDSFPRVRKEKSRGKR